MQATAKRKRRVFKPDPTYQMIPGSPGVPYIHSNTFYMMNYRKMLFGGLMNDNTADAFGKEFIKDIRKAMVALLEDLVRTWQDYRQAFINQAIQRTKGLEDPLNEGKELKLSSDPTKFLKQYNDIYSKAAEGKLAKFIIDLKQKTADFKAIKGKTGGAQAQAELVMKNWTLILDFITEMLAFYERKYKEIEQALLGTGKTMTEKEMGTLRNIKKSIEESLKEIFKITNNKGITDLINKINNLRIDKNFTQAQQMELFNKIMNEWYFSMGFALEHIIDDVLNDPKNEALYKITDKQSANTNSRVAETLHHTFVGDVFSASITLDTKEIKLYTSAKLTQSYDATRKYSTQDDVLETDKFNLNSQSLEMYRWLRYNMVTLSEFAKDGVKPSKNARMAYQRLEQNVAVWLLLPRIIDGVYEDITKKAVTEGYHTSMFYTKGEFFWTADILEYFKDLLDNSTTIEQIRAGGISSRSVPVIKSPVSEEKLKNLLQQKHEAIKKLGKDKMSYAALSKYVDLENISSEFRGWRPVKEISTHIKYSVILKK